MFLPSNNISDILTHMKRELRGLYKQEEIRSFWFILLEEYCGLNKTSVLSDQNRTISESEMLKVHFAIKELKKNRPIQHITRKAWFRGIELKVTPDTLIPRPETEELVEWIIEDFKDKKDARLRILDIGTGSGCIAIALAKSFPNAEVYGIDETFDIVEVAWDNAISNKCQIKFEEWDIMNKEHLDLDGLFDIIVSNPPYVRLSEMKYMKANVLQYEPESALFVMDEEPLVYYSAILRYASNNLVSDGTIYFEINAALSMECLQLVKDHGYSNSKLRKDIHRKDRMLRCRK